MADPTKADLKALNEGDFDLTLTAEWIAGALAWASLSTNGSGSP